MQEPNQKPNQEPAEFRPEKKYTVIITATEAEVIKRYRELAGFDQMIVTKRGGRLMRIEATASFMYAPQLGEQAALEIKGIEVIE